MTVYLPLNMGIWDLNSGLHAFMARAFPVKPRMFLDILTGPTRSHGWDSSHQMAQSRRLQALMLPYLPAHFLPGPLSTLSPKVRAGSLSPPHPHFSGDYEGLIWLLWHVRVTDTFQAALGFQDLQFKATQLWLSQVSIHPKASKSTQLKDTYTSM